MANFLQFVQRNTDSTQLFFSTYKIFTIKPPEGEFENTDTKQSIFIIFCLDSERRVKEWFPL